MFVLPVKHNVPGCCMDVVEEAAEATICVLLKKLSVEVIKYDLE